MIRDIPESVKLTAVQQRIHDCVCSGRPWFGPDLWDALSTLEYPLYFMDFETLYPALPRFKGMWPYSHIPFQWSVHVRERPGAELSHHEFLAEDDTDPRLRFLETLLDVLGTAGGIMVYNCSFETARLGDLAGWCPNMQADRPCAGSPLGLAAGSQEERLPPWLPRLLFNQEHTARAGAGDEL